jgi:hypothetical protein
MEFESRHGQSARKPSAAERDAAAAALRDAFVGGHLTLEEFRDRVGTVLAAENVDELEQATAGISRGPVAGSVRTVSTMVAFLGHQSRAGRWRLPGRLRVFGILGDVHLDLGSAVCTEETVDISAWALLGEIELQVPEGVEVELAGFDLFGRRRLQLARARPLPGAPHIRIRTRAAFGDVSVRSTGGETAVADGYRARGGSGRRRLIFAAIVFVLLVTFLLWPNGDGGKEPATARGVATPSAASSRTSPDTLTAPNVVGKRLADAQETLQAAGFAKVDANDASSAGRIVLNPQNWVVTAQSPLPGVHAPMDSTATLKVIKPSGNAADQADQAEQAGNGGGPVARGVLPDVVCMDLQAAEDRLQQAGFANVRSTDGSGQARMQIIDRNWVVTAQSPPAGRRPPAGTRVVLTSVKHGEPTGSSGCRA